MWLVRWRNDVRVVSTPDNLGHMHKTVRLAELAGNSIVCRGEQVPRVGALPPHQDVVAFAAYDGVHGQRIFDQSWPVHPACPSPVTVRIKSEIRFESLSDRNAPLAGIVELRDGIGLGGRHPAQIQAQLWVADHLEGAGGTEFLITGVVEA